MKMWLNILGERSSADEKNKIESIASIKTVNCGGLFFLLQAVKCILHIKQQ